MNQFKFFIILGAIILVPLLSGDINKAAAPTPKLLDWEEVTCHQITDTDTRVVGRFGDLFAQLPFETVKSNHYHLTFSFIFDRELGKDGANIRLLLVNEFNEQQEVGELDLKERYNQGELQLTAQIRATGLLIRPIKNTLIPEFTLSDLSFRLTGPNESVGATIATVRPLYASSILNLGQAGQSTVTLKQEEMIAQGFSVEEDQVVTNVDIPIYKVGNGGLGFYRLRIMEANQRQLIASTTFEAGDLGKIVLAEDVYRFSMFGQLRGGVEYLVALDASGVKTDSRNHLSLRFGSSEDGKGKVINNSERVLRGNVAFSIGLIDPDKNIRQEHFSPTIQADSLPFSALRSLSSLNPKSKEEKRAVLGFDNDKEVSFLQAEDGNSLLFELPPENLKDMRELRFSLDSPCADTVPLVVEYSVNGVAWQPIESIYLRVGGGTINRYALVLALPENTSGFQVRISYDEAAKSFSRYEYLAFRAMRVVVQ